MDQDIAPVAPEDVLRPHLQLLYAVVLQVRQITRNGPLQPAECEIVHDLMDAVHNIPEMLLNYGAWWDETRLCEDRLRQFDERWAGLTGFSLEKMLGEARRARVPQQIPLSSLHSEES